MASPPGSLAPRPPFLQRITPKRWLSIDIGLSVVLFAAELGSVFWGNHDTGPFPRTLLVVIVGFATLPIALRRKYPLQVLIVVTCATALATIGSHNLTGAPLVALPLFSVATQYERRDSIRALCATGVAIVASVVVADLVRRGNADQALNSVLAGGAA